MVMNLIFLWIMAVWNLGSDAVCYNLLLLSVKFRDRTKQQVTLHIRSHL
jgi:hypothetical protein